MFDEMHFYAVTEKLAGTPLDVLSVPGYPDFATADFQNA
jgi:hypothetical protein